MDKNDDENLDVAREARFIGRKIAHLQQCFTNIEKVKHIPSENSIFFRKMRELYKLKLTLIVLIIEIKYILFNKNRL